MFGMESRAPRVERKDQDKSEGWVDTLKFVMGN